MTKSIFRRRYFQTSMILTSLTLACFPCGSAGEDRVPTVIEYSRANTESAGAKQSPPFVVEFFRLATADSTAEGPPLAARRYAAKLSPAERITLAQASARHADPLVKTFGLDLFVNLGREDEAVPEFANLVAAGDELAGFGLAWLNSDKSDLLTRMTVKIQRYLLNNYERYNGEAKANVEAFLGTGPRRKPRPAFSKKEAEERLRALETAIEHPHKKPQNEVIK